MIQKGFVRCLLGLLCVLSIMTAGCKTGIEGVDGVVTRTFGGDSREFSWIDFQENRPEPEYVIFNTRELTDICAEITKCYGDTLKHLDKFVARMENAHVAMKLERIYSTEGEEAYFAAYNSLTKEEEKSYRKYIKNELHYLELFEDIDKRARGLMDKMPKITNAIQHEFLSSINKHDPIELATALGQAAGATAQITEQIEFTARSVAWIVEYYKLLDRAKTYQGR